MTAAIVLAAGASTRMGRPKQLLLHQNETLIHHAVRSVIEAACSPCIIVLGANAEACATSLGDLIFIRADNLDWHRGIGTSIRRGFEAMLQVASATQIKRLVLSLADQPNVDTAFIRQLIARSQNTSRPIVAAKFGDTIGPPVCVARSEFASLASVPDDRGAKSLWMKRPDLLETIDCPAAAFDIDTPADYQRLLAAKEDAL